MPPPDTSLLPDPSITVLPLDSSVLRMDSADLMQYALRLVDSMDHVRSFSQVKNQPQYQTSQLMMFLIVLGMLAILYLLTTQLPKLAGNRHYQHAVEDAKADLLLRRPQYHEWLTKYNPYYAGLTTQLQQRFLERTILFMHQKEFRYHSMQEADHISVLISGAAVQMTFGLKNYLLDYFPVIHVIRKEYVLDMDKETYYGHVSRSGIYISWNHFVEGFEDYTDSVNVGLHEMAHAVSFDVFLGQCDHHDYAFRNRLEEFAQEGRPVFRAMRSGMSHLLDDYGATNFDEFWAVCVETFFENPGEFRANMPDLYISVAELLNQDPLLPSMIIDPALAGLA